MKPARQTVITIIALLLVVGGGSYLLWPKMRATQVRQRGMEQNAIILEAAQKTVSEPNINGNLAVKNWKSLQFERLQIYLTLKEGTYLPARGEWQLDKYHAFLMSNVPTPTIYGHNIPAIFSKLSGIAPDELLQLQDNTGAVSLFSFVSEEQVAPNTTAFLREIKPDSLRIITCSEAPFTYRRILSFKHVGELPAMARQQSARLEL